METNNLLHVEFKTLVIKMLNAIRGRKGELSENCHKQIETIKKEK